MERPGRVEAGVGLRLLEHAHIPWQRLHEPRGRAVAICPHREERDAGPSQVEGSQQDHPQDGDLESLPLRTFKHDLSAISRQQRERREKGQCEPRIFQVDHDPKTVDQNVGQEEPIAGLPPPQRHEASDQGQDEERGRGPAEEIGQDQGGWRQDPAPRGNGGIADRPPQELPVAPPAGSQEELTKAFKRQLLLVAGFKPDEIKDEQLEMDEEGFQTLVREKLLKEVKNNHAAQKVVGVEELESSLLQGWEFVGLLPNNKAVVKQSNGA